MHSLGRRYGVSIRPAETFITNEQNEQSQKQRTELLTAVSPLPRRADAQQLAEDQAEIEPGHMNQQPLENVVMFSQVRTPHPTRVVAVREAAFYQLTASSEYFDERMLRRPRHIHIGDPDILLLLNIPLISRIFRIL